MTPLVGLVTDFGRADSYVAEVHLAIRACVPTALVVDVTHEVPAYDRLAAALAAERGLARMPRGSALAIVVDPGVGGARRRVIARRDGVWIVAPDNGVFPVRAGTDTVWVVREGFREPAPGVATFDGREVFGPLAAWLSAGLRPELAGRETVEYVRPVLPPDAEFESGADARYARGVVIALDRFGNAVTNVRTPRGLAPAALRVEAPEPFRGVVRRAYSDVEPGAPLALVGSSGRLELAVREGPSGVAVGSDVVIRCPT